MTPTQEQVNEVIGRIEREQGEFRSLGDYNRQIARERIAQYRKSVDDIVETRVTGTRSRWPTDPDTTMRLQGLHHADAQRRSLFRPFVLLLGLGLLGYALIRVVMG